MVAVESNHRNHPAPPCEEQPGGTRATVQVARRAYSKLAAHASGGAVVVAVARPRKRFGPPPGSRSAPRIARSSWLEVALARARLCVRFASSWKNCVAPLALVRFGWICDGPLCDGETKTKGRLRPAMKSGLSRRPTCRCGPSEGPVFLTCRWVPRPSLRRRRSL